MRHTSANLALLILLNIVFAQFAWSNDGRLMDLYPPNFKASNFSLYDINGNKQELVDFRNKYVLINFWAMSCNICKSEMTTLQSMYETLGNENFDIISIHAGDDREGVNTVVELNQITYTVLFDLDLQLGGWGIPILPTSFIVSPEGNILYRAVGSRVWNSPFMIDFLQSLINKTKKNSDNET